MSIKFRVTESLGAPPERVFSAFTDLDGAAHWMPGFVRVEPIEAYPPLRVGSRWRQTRRLYGREASEVFELTEMTPPSRLALRVDGTQGSSKQGEYLFTYSFAPEGYGTRVAIDAEIRRLRGLSALLGRFFVGSFRKAILKDLHSLDAYLAGTVPIPQVSQASAQQTVPPSAG